VQRDAVVVMVDHHLVAAVAIDRLLQAEHQRPAAVVCAEHREQVLDHTHFPLWTFRPGGDGRRRAFLVAAAERAALDVCAGVALGRLLRLAGAHRARGGDQHRLGRHHRVDADLADRFRFAAHGRFPP
jgi:hypothetical protein